MRDAPWIETPSVNRALVSREVMVFEIGWKDLVGSEPHVLGQVLLVLLVGRKIALLAVELHLELVLVVKPEAIDAALDDLALVHLFLPILLLASVL